MPKQHPIKIWLIKTGTSATELATRAGLHPSYISLMLTGRCLCGAGAAHRIEAATGGEVTASELVAWGRAA